MTNVRPFPGLGRSPQSRTLAPLSTDPSSGFAPARNDPDNWNLIHELVWNRPAYLPDPEHQEWLSIRRFPPVLSVEIERIRERVYEEARNAKELDAQLRRKPGTGVVLTVCGAYAVPFLAGLPEVTRIEELRRETNLREFEDPDAQTMMSLFLRTFRDPGLEIDGGDEAAHDSWKVPKDLMAESSAVAEVLGIDKRTMAVLWMLIALADEPTVHQAKQAEYEGIVKRFLKKLEWRLAGAKALAAVWR